MANTYELISSVTVGASGASSIDFTSIPATYTDLVIKGSLRSTATGSLTGGFIDSSVVSVNGTTTNSTFRLLYGAGSSASSNSGSIFYMSPLNGAGSTSNTFSSYELYIPNYGGSAYKSASFDAAAENNASTNFMGMGANLKSITAAITSLSLVAGEGNWAQYSTAYLYGIKNS